MSEPLGFYRGLDLAIEQLACRLVDGARIEGTHVSWRTPHLSSVDGAGRPSWRAGDTTPYLYDGQAGIARALAYGALAVAPARPALAAEMRRCARMAGADAVQSCRSWASPPPGLYDGASGVACAAVEVARVCDDRDLEAAGLALARSALRVPELTHLDLISGAAGQVCAAGWLARWTGETWLVTELLNLAGHLRGHALPEPGLAHGTAGLAVAFAHAYAVSHDAAWLAPVTSATEPEPAMPGPPVAWCHGATGRALAAQRIGTLSGRPDPESAAFVDQVRQRLLTAVADAAQWTDDWSLCHGTTGAVALLLAADQQARTPRPAAAARAAERLLTRGIFQASSRDGRWQGGMTTAEDQPGLMNGHAGILLTLIRARYRAAAFPLWL